jgi:hypothetical protein
MALVSDAVLLVTAALCGSSIRSSLDPMWKINDVIVSAVVTAT